MSVLCRQLQARPQELAEPLDDGQPNALTMLLARRCLGRIGRGCRRACHVAPTVGARVPRRISDPRCIEQLLRERRGVGLVDSRAGVLDGERPTVRVASMVEPPN
jgi:hypothetical protein